MEQRGEVTAGKLSLRTDGRRPLNHPSLRFGARASNP